MNDAKLEWIIPFIILGAMLLPKFLKGVPVDNLNELIVLLVTCILIGIVISVLRHIRRMEKE